MTDFFDELLEGGIQFRDKYQFELKTDYAPLRKEGGSTYTDELYFFIPTSLQINHDTYSRTAFYHDQTTYIRYKTPQLSLVQLVDLDNSISPLAVLAKKMRQDGSLPEKTVLFELKLFANMVRSRIRDRVRNFMTHIKRGERIQEEPKIVQFCANILDLRTGFDSFQEEFLKKRVHAAYLPIFQAIDEFISYTIEHYLTGFLEFIRSEGGGKAVDAALTERILYEQQRRLERGFVPEKGTLQEQATYMMQRAGLLNKFVSDVLFLNIERKEPSRRFTQFGAALAAAFAMFVYIVLLTMHTPQAVFDSTAFIVLSVLLYVLKDRLKESVRNYSARLAARWYPDYTTSILAPGTGTKIGKLSEYVSFIDSDELPPEIQKVRNDAFQDEYAGLKRPESILFVKKEVELFPGVESKALRLKMINDLFRFNISQFLLKAGDAQEAILVLDPLTKELQQVMCSRLYTIFVVIKSLSLNKAGKRRIDFDCFKIVLDKEGIKHIDKVPA